MMARTKPYCKLVIFPSPIDFYGIQLAGGWWMSDEAVADMDRYEWVN
jgi:hypothetical protein